MGLLWVDPSSKIRHLRSDTSMAFVTERQVRARSFQFQLKHSRTAIFRALGSRSMIQRRLDPTEAVVLFAIRFRETSSQRVGSVQLRRTFKLFCPILTCREVS